MTLNAIAEELAEEQPGSNLVIAKLADLLFISLSARIWLDLLIPSAGCAAWTLLAGVPSLACTLHRANAYSLATEGRGRLFEPSSQRFSALVGQGALSY